MRTSNCSGLKPLAFNLVTLLALIIGSVVLLPTSSLAQGPENTVVVVNSDSPDSLAIANRYVQLRDIPAANVIYLKNITNWGKTRHGVESTGSKNFRVQIMDPILKTLKDRGIENQIDCIAYSAGFPTRINFQPEMKTYLKQTGKEYAITQHAPWASITSLTYLHRNAFSDTPTFLALDANRFANPRRMKVLANPFSGAEATNYSTAIRQMTAHNYDDAAKSLTKLANQHPQQTAVIYSLARCMALNGQKDKALEALQRIKSLGFAYRSVLTKDTAFLTLKSEPAFKQIVDQMEDLPDGLTATRSFSSQNFWGPNGWANGTRDQGERYMLSSVLAVTGKNQSSLKASLDRLESSVAADGTAPKGNVYFADHKDPRSRTRKSQFRFAAAELQSMGRTASIGSAIYPTNDRRVIGVTMGSAVPKWPASKSKFLPGAICDNFTSYGAWWEKSGQTQISEFLDAGAAGASGTVYEPYTISAKIPSARWHAHYARGATLAESFFQSVSGPFQLLLVGDPLCCPFGKFPKFKITGLQDGDTVTEDFILKLEQQAGSPPIEHFELYYDDVFLSRIANTNEIKIATDATTDGYHEIRIVAVSDAPIAKKKSQKVSFTVNRKGLSINLNIENPSCILGESLRIKAVSSLGNPIQILQNRRTVATVQSGQYFEIPTSELGAGTTTLQAVAMLSPSETIKSKPVPVLLAGPSTTPSLAATNPLASLALASLQTIPSHPAVVSLISSPTIQDSDRRQPPNKAELKEAIARIRELLKDKYKDSSSEGRTALLKLLQKTANESVNKPVNHYALLSECIYAASEFNSVDAGWSACNQLDSSYDFDELPHIGFIKQIKTKLSPESAATLYSNGVKLSQQLIDNDRFADARELAKTLGAALKKSLPGSKSEIDAIADRAKTLARKFKQIQDDLTVLADDPSSEQANQNVGEFYCLEKTDFKTGLPFLAKGSKGPVRDLANQELSQRKPTLQQRLEIANGWWELAQNKKLKGFKKIAISHYQQILDGLQGLTKIKVEQRINETLLGEPKSTLSQLSNHTWKIEFNDGIIFKQVRRNKDRLSVVSISGKSYQWKFREIANVIETSNDNRTVLYEFAWTNGQLRCSRLVLKTNKTSQGLGIRIEAGNPQQ